MDTTKNSGGLILDFTSYIKQFFPEYIFDEHNTKLIRNLGLWATRDIKFNNLEPGWHLDRAILLVGAPGVGKDVIFRLLRKYLSYIMSPYSFADRIVWQYATKFKDKDLGYDCFNDVPGNCYYQELARTDENVSPLTLTREAVQHYGNKVLIGNELINVRYNMFINMGYQSHFSSNHNEDQLEKLYGVRCVDRLREMCNYMILAGSSKRGKVAPSFVSNRNVSAPPPARETTVDEHKENRELLESDYKAFLETGNVSDQASLRYVLLRSYGCHVATDEEIRILMEEAEATYPEKDKLLTKSSREKDKQTYTWDVARKVAVHRFYTSLKAAGAKTIFEIVSVPVDGLLKPIVIQSKNP